MNSRMNKTIHRFKWKDQPDCIDVIAVIGIALCIVVSVSLIHLNAINGPVSDAQTENENALSEDSACMEDNVLPLLSVWTKNGMEPSFKVTEEPDSAPYGAPIFEGELVGATITGNSYVKGKLTLTREDLSIQKK